MSSPMVTRVAGVFRFDGFKEIPWTYANLKRLLETNLPAGIRFTFVDASVPDQKTYMTVPIWGDLPESRAQHGVEIETWFRAIIGSGATISAAHISIEMPTVGRMMLAFLGHEHPEREDKTAVLDVDLHQRVARMWLPMRLPQGSRS